MSVDRLHLWAQRVSDVGLFVRISRLGPSGSLWSIERTAQFLFAQHRESSAADHTADVVRIREPVTPHFFSQTVVLF